MTGHVLPMRLVKPVRQDLEVRRQLPLYRIIHASYYNMIEVPPCPSLGKSDFTRSTDSSNKKQKHKPKFESIVQCLKNKG